MSLAPGQNADRVILVVFCIISAVLGILGNLFIMGAVLVEKKLRFAGSVFVVNLAIADFATTATVFPLMAINLIWEGNVLNRTECVATAYVAVLGAFASTCNIALVATDRYFCVCNEPFHKQYFTLRNIKILTILSWIYPILLTMPNIAFDVGPIQYQTNYDLCTISFPKDNVWFGLLLTVGGMQLPIAICCVCYFKIAKTVWMAKRKIRNHQNGANTLQDRSAVRQSDVELYRTLFIIFVLFLVCWMPVGVCQMLVDTKTVESIADPLYRSAIILALFNSVLNSFVYGFTNKHFKRGYITLVAVMFAPFYRLLRSCWQSAVPLCAATKWLDRKLENSRFFVATIHVRPVEQSTAVTELL